MVMDCFCYCDCWDLLGYIDGFENLEGENVYCVVFVDNDIVGFKGFSFVLVQQWFYNLMYFKVLLQFEQDNIMGCRMLDNEEFDEVFEFVYVKCFVLENFFFEVFMLCCFMFWSKDVQEGLVFFGFGYSL